MSAYDHLKKTIGYHEEKGNKEFTYSTKAARNSLNETDNQLEKMEKLKRIVSHIPLQVGDVVHERGYPQEKGDVVKVEDEDTDPIYLIMIRHRRDTFWYYRDELDLMERPGA
jgi:hypothetical protein